MATRANWAWLLPKLVWHHRPRRDRTFRPPAGFLRQQEESSETCLGWLCEWPRRRHRGYLARFGNHKIAVRAAADHFRQIRSRSQGVASGCKLVRQLPGSQPLLIDRQETPQRAELLLAHDHAQPIKELRRFRGIQRRQVDIANFRQIQHRRIKFIVGRSRSAIHWSGAIGCSDRAPTPRERLSAPGSSRRPHLHSEQHHQQRARDPSQRPRHRGENCDAHQRQRRQQRQQIICGARSKDPEAER